VLLSALRSLARQAGLFVAILLGVGLLVRVFEGQGQASVYLELTLRAMLGFWVWTLGWGLVSFVRSEAPAFTNDLVSILEPSGAVGRSVGILERSVLHRAALPLTASVAGAGLLLTLVYGVPLSGIGYWAVVLGVTSIYYASSFLLWHFLSVLRAFQLLLMSADNVRFRDATSPLHLESLLSYLSLTTTLGVLAIYVGFRGTLTAGFLFEHESLKAFLLTPLILYLPATLLYNFHPRYVLRRLIQHRVFRAMNRLSVAKVPDLQQLVLEIRELGLTNAQILPFIDYKSLPSYAISILFVLSLAYHNDPAVKGFLGYLLGVDP